MTSAECERLVLLIEECGEVIQAATKVLRHGYGGAGPGRENNRTMLSREVGDLHAILGLMTARRDLDFEELSKATLSKTIKLQDPNYPYVYFQAKRDPPSPKMMGSCDVLGCKNLKLEGAMFCESCLAKFREDPDAFK